MELERILTFWYYVLGDHLMFITDTLSVEEIGFHERLGRIRTELEITGNKGQFTIELALALLEQVEELTRELLARHVEGRLKLALPPTFLNHTLNEYAEMRRDLTVGVGVDEFTTNAVWLNDAAGHADSLCSMLDPIEPELRKQLKHMKKAMEKLFLANNELSGYTRAIDWSSRLVRAREQINLHLLEFINVLTALREARVNGNVLATFTALLPDHMLREEMYYLTKIGLGDYPFDQPRIVVEPPADLLLV